MFRAWVGLLFCTLLLVPQATFAQPAPSLELSFTPIDRAQIAVWVEREDGTFMGTLALTYAVAKAGIGNRPGALQMNSGFRWPYGRREGVLPVWAHRRAQGPDAKQWKRVIFQNRSSEGYASRTSDDMSRDNFYCLSFQRETTGRDALDAVTCASVFSSDKGRFINEQDTARDYAEPFETAPGVGSMRALGLTSLYPPRRDVDRCSGDGCYDHPDVALFRGHALEVMPELDVVTRATLPGRRPAQWTFELPSGWPRDVRYRLFIEVNVEGDYNDAFSTAQYPTPKQPAERWDSWALDFGYPYRGQPSVVYALDFSLAEGGTSRTLDALGVGDLHGQTGELMPVGASISNDPANRPGSGADRLLAQNGTRASLRVLVPDSKRCMTLPPPEAVGELAVGRHPNKHRAHMWARMTFKVPASAREISSYVVEVREDGKDEWEQAYTPDAEQELLPVALDVCADPQDPTRNRCLGLAAGTQLEVTLAGLSQLTRYEVRVMARDRECGALGPPAMTELTTPEVEFATVTPCFVASAAYGSPLAAEIAVLRQVRDRYLMPTALGRSLVDLYYQLGPQLAETVRERPWLRSTVRAILTPLVKTFAWWLDA